MQLILIVDDDRKARMVLGRLLEHMPDIRVRYAANGEQALAIARFDIPDVIVLDEHMPVMTGNELIITLERSTWGADIPIILMREASSKTRNKLSAESVALTLQKPINAQLLTQYTMQLLGKESDRNESSRT